MSSGLAFTRAVSPRLPDCALTHLARRPIDVDRAVSQHAAYEDALAAAGFEVVRLPPLPEFADGVFVEDTAIVLGDHALITRPGAASRGGEVESTAAGLADRLEVRWIEAGFVDGGDVLRIGDTLFVGLSGRTDRAGLEALARAAAPLGISVAAVPVAGCLHLKTAVTFAGPDAAGRPVLVHDPAAVAAGCFGWVDAIAVSPDEPAGANVLRAGSRLFVAANAPRTAKRLAARGFDVVALDMSELQKAEAGLTCMSLIAPDAG